MYLRKVQDKKTNLYHGDVKQYFFSWPKSPVLPQTLETTLTLYYYNTAFHSSILYNSTAHNQK